MIRLLSPGVFLLSTIAGTFLLSALAGADAPKDPNVVWHNAQNLTIEGRGWTDTADYYNRLPARAKGKVPEGVWGLSLCSSGMVVRFVTDSPEINVKWKLNSSNLAMEHMPATGVSGVDLYVKHKGTFRALGTGFPRGVENEAKLISGISPESREYALYLPLYNGVTSVEIGIAKGSNIEPAEKRSTKPVVYYGSSITQGGCASRPGMAYESIISRRLDVENINLGFSGSGKCEREVADLLAELDPEVFVIDCMPNMEASYVDERISYLLNLLKQKHPHTPVVLVEEAGGQNAYIWSDSPVSAKNVILEKIYDNAKKDWGGKLFYVKGNDLVGTDSEATVDCLHPTDLGFQRMADVLTPVVKKALAASKS